MKLDVTASTNSKILSVFWYTGDQFVGVDETLDGSSIIEYGSFLQVDVDHFQIWDSVRRYYNLPDVEYDYYPRGRISYNSKLHKFWIVGDSKIVDNPEIQNILLHQYGISRQAAIFESDEHYQSEYAEV